jgi:hypothetical protein
MALTKATNRMIADAPVNVKDFGAVGDGVTDDSAAVRAAIAYCGDNKLTLMFSSGTYLIDTNDSTYTTYGLAITYNNLKMVGSTSVGGGANGQCVIKAGPNVTGTLMGCPVRQDGLILQDLSFDGSDIADYCFQAAVTHPYSSTERCKFRQATIAGFKASGFVWKISHCLFEDNVIGLKIVSNGGSPNTSLDLNNCYANRNVTIGYDIDLVRYSNFSTLAADANALAYDFKNLRGVSINGIGMESCPKGILLWTNCQAVNIVGISFSFTQGIADPLVDDLIDVRGSSGVTIGGIELYQTDNRYTVKIDSNSEVSFLSSTVINHSGKVSVPILVGSQEDFTFLNGWVEYASATYRSKYQKIGNTVHVYLMVKSGTTGVVATLPAGYIPSDTRYIYGMQTSLGTGAGNNGTVAVLSNGDISFAGYDAAGWTAASFSFNV